MPRKRKVLKKWARILFLIVLIVIAIAAMFVITKGIKNIKSDKTEIAYSYNMKQNIDYKINLYDNSFIDAPTLGEGQMYISDLVRNIESTFNYSYSGTDVIPLNYDYTIIATINGKYQLKHDDTETKVWTKEYVLKEKTKIDASDKNNFTINENIVIDYNFFNQVVSEFRKELRLSITAALNVKMKVNVTGDLNGQKVSETKELYVEIPLNQQAFQVEEHYEKEYANTIFKQTDNVEKGKNRIIIGSIMLIIDIFLFFNLYKLIFNIRKKNNYTITLNKILKEYGEIIVEVVNPIEEEDLNIVEVKNFNEMIDLEEELRIPIMFFEKEEYYEGQFVIVHNNILYKYLLTNETQD